ncbi:hypothetical protein BX600DRAFT_508060 [Xylariales sp. PMI_506]|nr:hypothetical protein BX600DRAFT_508060 [Xylariales sp. PMI_506]
MVRRSRQQLPRLLAAALLSVALQPHVQAHGSGSSDSLSFSGCVADCVEDQGCSVVDVGCICQAAQDDFLANLVTCTYTNCSDGVSVDSLVKPIKKVCKLLGQAVPASAISSASAAASSIEYPQSTTTHTTTTTTTSTKKTTSHSTTSPSEGYPTATVETTKTETESKTTASTTPSNTAEASTGTIVVNPSTASSPSTGTTVDTGGGPSNPTDSSPFATIPNSGRRERASLLAAILGLGTAIVLG